MKSAQTAFQINVIDNVATATQAIASGLVKLLGETQVATVTAIEEIPVGHKIALREILPDEMIVKYGVVIGRGVTLIPAGGWVHLHCMCSNYDEGASKFDLITGASKDIPYE